MFTATFRTLACLLVLSLLASCSDDSTAPSEPVETNVTLETGNTVSESIGSEGGTLSTTADDGTVYVLEIPEGSIPENETITMTPIVDIDGYPVADGVAAGVDLKPDGLVFAVPAILTIETAKTPGTGLVPVAITYEGDATSFAPGFVGTGVGTFTIPIEHFTGWSVGFATAAELEVIVRFQAAPCLEAAVNAFSAGEVPGAIAAYRACFTSDVLPAIVGATTDTTLARAIGQYNMWKTDSRIALGMAPFNDATETQQAMDALVPKLQQAITANNDECRQKSNILSATPSIAKVLFWQRQAAHFGIDTVTNLLDRNNVLNNLCVRPVVDSFQLPANMQVGFPHSVDIQFGVIFAGQQPSKPAAFEVTLTGIGIDIQNPTGFTDFLGRYTTVVTATQQGSLSILATGCLVLPGTVTPTDICVQRQAFSGGLDLTGTWDGTAQLGTLPPVPASMTLNQNQNAISGTYEQCSESQPVYDLTATLSGSQLLNVALVFRESIMFGNGSVGEDTIVLQLTSTQGLISIQVTRGGIGCPEPPPPPE